MVKPALGRIRIGRAGGLSPAARCGHAVLRPAGRGGTQGTRPTDRGVAIAPGGGAQGPYLRQPGGGGGRGARPTEIAPISFPPSLPHSLTPPPSPSPSPHPSLNLALRRLVAAVHKNRIAFLFIADSSSTQHSSESSVVSHQSFTQDSALRTQHSKGGQALRFFASVRLEIERREWIRRGKEVVGCRSAVRVVKNKLAAPHREAEVELWFYRFPQQKLPVSASRWPVLCQTN